MMEVIWLLVQGVLGQAVLQAVQVLEEAVVQAPHPVHLLQVLPRPALAEAGLACLPALGAHLVYPELRVFIIVL